MNHTVRSLLVVAILLAAVIAIGILVGRNSVTGASVAGSIACYDDADCDDGIAATEDTCRNPGTENSLCVSRPKE